MSPRSRPDSEHYLVRTTVSLPGRGRVLLPWRSSGSPRKADARAMEQTLRDLPLMGYADLVERYIEDPALTPAELHAAKIAGRLEEVRHRIADLSLAAVVDEAKLGVKDERTLKGFDDLLRLAPAGAGISHISTPNRVKDLLLKHEAEGRRRNSVRRSLYRAIVLTLDRGYSKGRRMEIMLEVGYAPEDDERKLPITQELVERLIREAIDPVFAELLRVALGTGIDRAPLLRIKPRHLSAGRLAVLDTKNKARERIIAIPEEVEAALRRAIMLGGCGPSDLVFPFTPGQVRKHFDAAVERADIYFDLYGKLRLKDCRAIFATAYLASGGKLKDMMQIMGLTTRETAVRYQKMVPDDHQDDMRAAAKWLGINRYLEVVG